mmetsp:Transcript_11669/g.34971  ORF Transcript_11669/g.34971 Transcript_11669/m.34971 type:complete len:237 (+) Transcript_11669:277-987(+)
MSRAALATARSEDLRVRVTRPPGTSLAWQRQSAPPDWRCVHAKMSSWVAGMASTGWKPVLANVEATASRSRGIGCAAWPFFSARQVPQRPPKSAVVRRAGAMTFGCSGSAIAANGSSMGGGTGAAGGAATAGATAGKPKLGVVVVGAALVTGSTSKSSNESSGCFFGAGAGAGFVAAAATGGPLRVAGVLETAGLATPLFFGAPTPPNSAAAIFSLSLSSLGGCSSAGTGAATCCC